MADGLSSPNYWKKQTIHISFEYIQIMSSAPGLQRSVSSASCYISRFLWMASLCPKSKILRTLWEPWSHSREFCYDESRCHDNRSHLKDRSPLRTIASGVLCRDNVWSLMLLTNGTHPQMELQSASWSQVCQGAPQLGSSEECHFGTPWSLPLCTEQQITTCLWRVNSTTFIGKNGFSI